MMTADHGGILAEDRTDLVALPVLWWGAASKRDASHCWRGWGQSISPSGLSYQTDSAGVLECLNLLGDLWQFQKIICWSETSPLKVL